MSARATFRQARSLYRRGLREPVVQCAGEPDLAVLNAWARPYDRRPLCEQGTAMASLLEPRSVQFLGRRAEAPMVSFPRAMFAHENPRMYECGEDGERRDVGHPYRRRALRELSNRLFWVRHMRQKLYAFGNAGMASLELCVCAIRMDLAHRDAVQAWRRAA